MTRAEMAKILAMPTAAYSAWLTAQTNEVLRLHAEGRAAAARTVPTLRTVAATVEAIPGPPSMRDAILAARVPFAERVKQTSERHMQQARDRAPGR